MTTMWRACIAVVGLLVAAAPASAQYRRYLAEGATGAFFATKLSLANPDDVSTVSGFETSDVSTTIESNRPIAVDRMMEWGVDPVTRHGYGSTLETSTPS